MKRENSTKVHAGLASPNRSPCARAASRQVSMPVHKPFVASCKHLWERVVVYDVKAVAP